MPRSLASRLHQQQTEQRKPSGDEANCFATIDAPLSYICASCGERVAPDAITVVPYVAADRRFKLLQVHLQNGTFERGLVLAGMTTKDGIEYAHFCSRCTVALAHRQCPTFSAVSGLRLSPVPTCLSVLNPMEARMVGLGTCFTTCFTLGILGQAATRGNSINFWGESYDIVAKLPRSQSRCGVIRLRSPDSSSSTTYYHVRPRLLRQALAWLKANNPVYEHVVIDEEFLRDMPNDSGFCAIAQ